MEFPISRGAIVLNKELNSLDWLALDFTAILGKTLDGALMDSLAKRLKTEKRVRSLK